MFYRLLSSLLLIVITAAHSRAQDDPLSGSLIPDIHPANTIQIGGCSDTAAIDELRILTRTILDLLQNQDICCTPTPDPDIDECLSNPCKNGGTCTDLINGYQCVCSPGYTGTECALDINECASNPCQNGGTCTDEINGYSCDCTPGFGGTECESEYQRDCAEIQAGGMHVSGVHTIYPEGDDVPLFVYCDMDTDGGGWTVFQRRQDGTVDFYVDWNSYKNGFGSVTSEHWLGNDNIHHLSTQKQYELRIDLEDFDGQTRYAVFSDFSLADETAKYILTIGDYSGDAGDSLSYNHGSPFTTKDQDNDVWSGTNCADNHIGAWWYHQCSFSNLNGQYLSGETGTFTGVFWNHWLGSYYSLKKTEMKFRPV